MENILDCIDQLDISPKDFYKLHTSIRDTTKQSSDDEAISDSKELKELPLFNAEEKSSGDELDDYGDSSLGIGDNIAKFAKQIANLYCSTTKSIDESSITKLKSLIFALGQSPTVKDKEELCEDRTDRKVISECTNVGRETSLENVEKKTELTGDTITNNSKEAQNIAILMSELISQEYCYICLKNTKKRHYEKSPHLFKVRSWLCEQIKILKKPIDPTQIFCDACNLPLLENSDQHYKSKLHLDNAKDFCATCVTVVKKRMTTHCMTNSHLENLSKSHPYEADSNSTNTIVELAPLTRKSSSKRDQVNNNIACDETLKHKEIEDSSKKATNKKFEKLADYILKLTCSHFCYICTCLAQQGHYPSQLHNMNMLKWFESNTLMLELFKISRFDELCCLACGCVFYDSHQGRLHYESEAHKKKMETFCRKCLIHDDPRNHLSHNEEVKEFPKIKENVGVLPPGVVLSLNLKLLCTPLSCEVCKVAIPATNIYHYMERGHILSFRAWMLNFQQIKLDPKILFCEACGLVLCGTEIAYAHYKTPVHLSNQQTYCEACILRGAPNIMMIHFQSWECKHNWHKVQLATHQLSGNRVPVIPAENAMVNSGYPNVPFMTRYFVPAQNTSAAPVANVQSTADGPVISNTNQEEDCKCDCHKEDSFTKQIIDEINSLRQTLKLFSNKTCFDETLKLLKEFNTYLKTKINNIDDGSRLGSTSVDKIGKTARPV